MKPRAGFLVVGVRDKMQRDAIYSLRRLNGADVEVKADDRMTQIKGTIIRYENTNNNPTEHILEELKQSKAVNIILSNEEKVQ